MLLGGPDQGAGSSAAARRIRTGRAGDPPGGTRGRRPGARSRRGRRGRGRRRANRATRGALAALLCLEAFVVLLVPRGIAQTRRGFDDQDAAAGRAGGGAGRLRLPAPPAVGDRLGWSAAGAGRHRRVVPALAVVVVIFLLLWLYLLRTRRIWLRHARRLADAGLLSRRTARKPIGWRGD